MTIEDQIKDEKLQYDVNRDAAKISALSSGKIDKYEYLTGEEILPSNQRQIIEQAKFTYSPLGEAFEKQIKTIENLGEKHIKAIQDNKKQLTNTQEVTIKNIILENILNDEAKKEIDKISEIEKTVDREKLVYRASEYTYSFQNFQTIRTFGRDIYNGEITLKEADEDQSSLLNEIKNFRDKTKPQDEEKKTEKKMFLKTCITFLRAEKKSLMLLIVKYFL